SNNPKMLRANAFILLPPNAADRPSHRNCFLQVRARWPDPGRVSRYAEHHTPHSNLAGGPDRSTSGGEQGDGFRSGVMALRGKFGVKPSRMLRRVAGTRCRTQTSRRNTWRRSATPDDRIQSFRM